MLTTGAWIFLCCCFSGPLSSSAGAEEPLHQQIDSLIGAKRQDPVAEKTTDAEFLRRIYLDFAGRIPSFEEAGTFLASSAPDRRERLIDQLLASPEYPRRMADAFHVMLMERQGDNEAWRKYLQDAFAANKPWDQLVREILSPDPNNESTRFSAFFLTKRLENYGQNPVDHPGLVRDVGRLFLGIDVQCAQCHDHLFVKDYKQADFQGLFAFLAQASIRSDVQFPAVSEKPLEKKLQFVSVFDMEPKETGPRVPGSQEVPIPQFKKGEEFAVLPDKKTKFPGVLKFSPLKVLSEQLPSAENVLFAKNFANRTWWLLMGRGLVHPLDLNHSDNPASHPELLELLAREVVAHKFDLRWLLRELSLTETYQRSTRLPEGVQDVQPDSYRVARERPLSPEQVLASVLQATGELATLSSDPKELTRIRERFAKALGNPPKEPELEYSPSVQAALFLSNDASIQGWLSPRPANLAEQLLQEPDPGKLVDRLFLTVLTRSPHDEERQVLMKHLQKFKDRRPVAARDAIWALIASTEFSLNH